MPATTLKFPDDIDSHEQFMHFRISKKYKFRRQAIEEKDTYATVVLPLPENLSTQYAASYSNESLQLLGNRAAATAGDNATAGSSMVESIMSGNITGAVNQLKKIGSNLTGGNPKAAAIELSKYYAEQAATAAAGLLAGSINPIAGVGLAAGVNQIIKGTRVGLGQARNPYLAAVFEGVNFKSHSFQFQLAPKNANESDTIRKILSAFRNAMLPGTQTIANYYDYPQQVDIVFKQDEYLFDIKTSVLTSFDINYHGKGAYYHDVNGKKAPVEVSINMNFLESSVRLSDDEKYGKQYGVEPPSSLGAKEVDGGIMDDTGGETSTFDRLGGDAAASRAANAGT